MTKRLVSLIIVVLVLLLLVGAWLAQQIGGVSIRLTEPERVIEGLTLPEVVVRGVPTTVGFGGTESQPTLAGELVWETEVESTIVQIVALPAASVGVIFPCTGLGEGRLLFRRLPDRRVLATAPVQLLPPGEDCALK